MGVYPRYEEYISTVNMKAKAIEKEITDKCKRNRNIK